MAKRNEIEAAAAALYACKCKEVGGETTDWDGLTMSFKKKAANYRRYAKIAIEAAESAKPQ